MTEELDTETWAGQVHRVISVLGPGFAERMLRSEEFWKNTREGSEVENLWMTTIREFSRRIRHLLFSRGFQANNCWRAAECGPLRIECHGAEIGDEKLEDVYRARTDLVYKNWMEDDLSIELHWGSHNSIYYEGSMSDYIDEDMNNVGGAEGARLHQHPVIFSAINAYLRPQMILEDLAMVADV